MILRLKPTAAMFFFVTLLALSLGSCAEEADPYSIVAEPCSLKNMPNPKMGEYLGSTAEEQAKTYLTPQCVNALLSVVPLDEKSFEPSPDGPPAGMKERMLEAFHAIVAYPLSVNEKDTSYLGTQPSIGGAIPSDFMKVFSKFKNNPNQSLFNFILEHIHIIKYGGVSNSYDAYFTTGTMTVYRGYWDTKHTQDQYRDPFIRAATLAHEAYHSVRNFHAPCNPEVTGKDSLACDSEFTGSYGFAAVYLKSLLHATATCPVPGCTPLLSQLNVEQAGWEMCKIGRSNLNNRVTGWPELDQLVGRAARPYSAVGVRDTFCSETVTYDWIMAREGIPLPPTPVASASVTNHPLVQDRDMKTQRCGSIEGQGEPEVEGP